MDAGQLTVVGETVGMVVVVVLELVPVIDKLVDMTEPEDVVKLDIPVERLAEVKVDPLKVPLEIDELLRVVVPDEDIVLSVLMDPLELWLVV